MPTPLPPTFRIVSEHKINSRVTSVDSLPCVAMKNNTRLCLAEVENFLGEKRLLGQHARVDKNKTP